MKNKILLAGVATLVFFAAFAGSAANPDAIELTPIPRPRVFESDMDHPVALKRVVVAVGTETEPGTAKQWLKTHFREWFGEFAPEVAEERTASVRQQGEEAYSLSADENGVKIAAKTLDGVRWAAYTLRQLVIAKRGTMTTGGFIVPTLKIEDRPRLKFRGVHLCWIPPMRPTRIERAIRLAALMKFNYVVLECWGMYKSEKHPWWSWPDATLTRGEVRRLVGIARDLGVTLIPQINVFGHASLSRSCTIKHAVLDLQPQYEPLFEPGGWNWCLTNPETQRVLRELVAEMHEAFGNPHYFHLGCDEAQPPGCPECRKSPYAELVARHIADLAAFVKARGAQAMIWHDMLLAKDDSRFDGFVKSGSKATAEMVDSLPKDIVICDWQYSYGDMNETRTEWPTFGYFKEKGFPVCACPWRNYNSMEPMADCIAKIGGFGMLETTWHHLRGGDWRNMYRFAAAAAWGTPVVTAPTQFDTPFANALRFVGQDMKVAEPEDTGDVEYQLSPY